MAKQLPYFKFYVAENLLGRIASESDAVQGMFGRACSHYWHKECNLTRDELEMKLGRKRVDLLITRGYVLVNENMICIPFLDEQMNEFIGLAGKRSEAGKKGFQAKLKQTPSKPEAKLKHLEERREEERRERGEERRGNFISINSEVFKMSPSEYFKKEFSLFRESWFMNNKQITEDEVYKRFDIDYFGYAFTEPMHVRNSFKTTWDKMLNEKLKNKNEQNGTIKKVTPGGFGQL